jgi:hypothetical protein
MTVGRVKRRQLGEERRMKRGSAVNWELIALASLLAACDHQVAEPSRSVAGKASAQLAPAEGGEAEVTDRFDITTQISGPLTPGATVHVSVVVVPRRPTAQAEINLVLPEVTAAARGGWTLLRAPMGQKLSDARQVVSLGAGQAAHLDYDVVIPVAGLFRAFVTVTKKSSEADTDGRRFVNPIATKESWFYIDANGGHASSAPDFGIVPDTIQPRLGPAQVKLRSSDGSLSRTNVRVAAATRTKRSISISGPANFTIEPDGNRHLIYFNGDSGSYQPATNVSLPSQECEYVSGLCYAPTSDMTDGNGRFWARCPDGNGEYYIQGSMELVGGGFYFSGPIGGFTEDIGSCTNDGGDWSLPGDNMEVFYHILDAVNASRAFFSPWSRSAVAIGISNDGTTSSHYDGGSDLITIQAQGDKRAIWGAYGLFTVAHEYGHALQNKALESIPGSTGCPSPHFINSHEGVTCAYWEGFADYHAVATRGPQIAALSGGSYWISEVEGDQARIDAGGGNTEDIEGSVAALFYHMTSSSDLNLPTRYVADLSAYCRFYSSSLGYYLYVNGADAAIKCAQGSLTADDQSLLSMRSLTGWSLVNTPTQPGNFNASTFRSEWHQRLFGTP